MFLKTHFHTDHQTGAEQLVEATGAKMAMGRNTGSDEADLLLDDGQELRFFKFLSLRLWRLQDIPRAA